MWGWLVMIGRRQQVCSAISSKSEQLPGLEEPCHSGSDVVDGLIDCYLKSTALLGLALAHAILKGHVDSALADHVEVMLSIEDDKHSVCWC